MIVEGEPTKADLNTIYLKDIFVEKNSFIYNNLIFINS